MSEKNAKLIKFYCTKTKRDYNAIKNWFKHLDEKDRIRALTEMRIYRNAWWASHS